MLVRHGNSTDNAADNPHESLVSSADEKILQVRTTIQLFVRRTVNGTSGVSCKTDNRFWGKHVSIDDTAAKIGNKPNR